MSLIEKRSEAIKNVQFEAHDPIRGKWPLRQIDGDRYWLQVIHDQNAVNAAQVATGPRAWLQYLPFRGGSPANTAKLLAILFQKRRILNGFNVQS